jgi:hypothetical protein
VSALTPSQLATRARFEAVIRLLEPGLNLLLAAGERISRLAPEDQVDIPPPRALSRDTSKPPG